MLIIPWFDVPAFRMEISLDGTPYVLKMRYNVISGFWSMDILSRDEALIAGSLRLVRGQPLIAQIVNPALPPGDFFLIGDGEPTRENMGVTVDLAYMEAADLAV